MRARGFITIFTLAFLGLFLLIRGQAGSLQDENYGPEVKSFLELCHHEEEELEFQIKHAEISRQDYIRSKNRIAIER